MSCTKIFLVWIPQPQTKCSKWAKTGGATKGEKVGQIQKKPLRNQTKEPEEGSVPGSLRGYDAVRHGRRGRGGVL